jgi:integrase/recombinase XerD
MKAALELSSKPNRDGLYEIYVRVQDGTKKKRIKANIAVKKNQFKSKNHNMKWVNNHPNHVSINADLKTLVEEYNDSLFEAAVAKKIVTPESLIFSINKEQVTNSLVKYCETKIGQMLNYNHRKGYQQTLNNWNAFTLEKKLGDLDFKQISVFVLKGFENYLFKNGLQASTVYTNMKRIRSLFNMAIKEQVIRVEDYIFKAYSMPKANKAKKEKLSAEELVKFAEVKCPKNSLTKTCQQAFLLSFNLAGVRIEDILTLEWKHVSNDRIQYRMEKTGALNSFKITPQIKKIIDYFRKYPVKTKFIVPILSDDIRELSNEEYKREIGRKTALVNKYLGRIAGEAGIDKKVSTHIARHSFASIAIKKSNGNINFVQNALKHSSPLITQAYLNALDDESLDDQMSLVTDLSKRKTK